MPSSPSCVDLSAATQRLKAFLAACLSAVCNMITAVPVSSKSTTSTTSTANTQHTSTSSTHRDPLDSPGDYDPLASVNHYPSTPITLVTPSGNTGPLRRPSSAPAPTTSTSTPSLNPPKMLAVVGNRPSLTTIPNSSTSEKEEQNNGGGSKRPKLSLQTSCLPVAFGKSTTALSFGLTTCYSASPTMRNTFNNAYDGFCSSVTSSAPATASSEITATTAATTPSLSAKCVRNGPAFAASRSSESAPPYQLPLGLRSILRNSPIRPTDLRRPSLSACAGNGRRKLFHATKRVNYRFPIEEEITTVRFVAKHSDLLSSTDSLSSTSTSPSEQDSVSSLSPSSNGEESDSSLSGASSGSCASDDELAETRVSREETAQAPKPLRKRKRRYTRSDRQILAAGIRDGLLSGADETPRTPIRPGRKRPREWKWTLGPIKDGYVQPAGDPDEALADTAVS